MKQFKPLKELIRALTYIGDAIAGKTVSDTQSTSNVYDGLIMYYDNGFIGTSEGINIKDNAFSKLGDLLSENLINDLNRELGNSIEKALSVHTKIYDYNGEPIPAAIIRIDSNNETLHYQKYDANGEQEFILHFTTSNRAGSWTKDTILSQART